MTIYVRMAFALRFLKKKIRNTLLMHILKIKIFKINIKYSDNKHNRKNSFSLAPSPKYIGRILDFT